MNEKLFVQATMGLALDPKLLREYMKILDELTMPNIPLPVMNGGEESFFWTNLAKCNGWTLQCNNFTHTARIVNSDGIRIAWGSLNCMEKALDKMVKTAKKYEKNH